jgi:hypothetical protein
MIPGVVAQCRVEILVVGPAVLVETPGLEHNDLKGELQQLEEHCMVKKLCQPAVAQCFGQQVDLKQEPMVHMDCSMQIQDDQMTAPVDRTKVKSREEVLRPSAAVEEVTCHGLPREEPQAEECLPALRPD